MWSTSRSRLLLVTSAIAGVVACDTGGPVLLPDAGTDAHRPIDGGRDASDAPTIDEEPPHVVETSPDDGALGVPATSTIEVTFSEVMADVGTAEIVAGGTTVAATESWSDDARTLTLVPAEDLPSSARVRVTLASDFTDEAGNALVLPYTFTFDVGDFDPPEVVSSDPIEGATDLGARMDTITITFSELMDSTVGSVALTGGAGATGTLRWLDGHTLRVPVSGLAYGTSYELSLSGFADTAANPLDPAPYLTDGVLDFTTGADVDAPRVLEASPAEGQVNVSLRGTPTATIVFDEPMDATVGTATLRVGSESVVVPGTWSAGNTRVALAISGRLRPDASHHVTLVGYEDAAGNALDPVTYLGDGVLDFDTGADVTRPVVVYSSPVEGSSEADHLLPTIDVVFDRGMDTSTVTLTVDDGVAPFAAPVTWNLAGTIASIDVTDRVHTGRSYRVALGSLRDLTGQPIVDDHPYLGDGVLDFGTRVPSGEECRDERTIAEATSTLPSGGHEWVFPVGSLATVDAASCVYPGSPSSSRAPDAVVRYVKTTSSGSSGGRYLHVRAHVPTIGNRISLSVYRGTCDGTTAVGLAARETCLYNRWSWDSYLDVGAGEYFVWAGPTTSSTPQAVTITIEEVDAIPEGEGCGDPFDTSSPGHSVVGGEHVWDVALDGFASVDMDTEFPGDGATICEEDQVQGPDFVVRFEKASDTTLLSVVAETAVDSFD